MSAGQQPQPPPRTVTDPTTNRPILMAPKRQQRPMHTGSKASDQRCPFCSGSEADTPAEVDAERSPESAPNGPGWRVRAFANLYPASLHHDVVAEGSEHQEHPCDLDEATWQAAVSVWRRRIVAFEQQPDVACAFLFKNVGARAGASIAHNHSQVLGLPEMPPRLQLELTQQQKHARCLICAAMQGAEQEQRVVLATDDFMVLAPDPPKLPFETWLMPRDCASDFLTVNAEALGTALHRWWLAVGNALDRPACNLWLHRIPTALLANGESFHWHFELQPRTGQLAGLELGGDMYINSVPAQATAARLRGE